MSLVYTVYLADEDGVVRCFGPGDDVPAWAKSKITNPLAWGETEDSSPKERAPKVSKSDGPPPQGGAGASRQIWADYAAKNGVEVKDDWKRDDIIAACEKVGVEI